MKKMCFLCINYIKKTSFKDIAWDNMVGAVFLDSVLMVFFYLPAHFKAINAINKLKQLIREFR